ncbi:hypothetical protein MMC08_009104 [Hypocenomyce scalaris]|nr:hypothetical protein [Hypocenomyce scalaris]
MEREYGFYANERAYKDRLKQWKFEKNLKASDMKILVAKAYKRAREDNKGTKFRFRGREMDREKMDRFKKRTTQEEELASPSASTPSGVSICTPSAGALTPNATFFIEDIDDGAPGGSFDNMEPVVQTSPRLAGVARMTGFSPREEPFNVQTQVFNFAQLSSNVDIATPPLMPPTAHPLPRPPPRTLCCLQRMSLMSLQLDSLVTRN